jgi:2-hydroxy-6-oxonona-2,4-dienedioate hydrolase
MRALFAAVLVLHGLAHVVGFLVPWRIVPDKSPGAYAAANRLLGGRVMLSDVLARGFGILWLLVGITMAVVAVRWWQREPTSGAALMTVVLVSLVLTAVWLPSARIGFVINVAILVGLALVVYLSYRRDVAVARTASRASSVMVNTAFGPIEYASEGAGNPVLSIHGTGGGWDQGIAAARGLVPQGFRVIAPSRFGYLRTPAPANASPVAEADAYAALLDELRVGQVSVISFSAGAAPAMQFALRYPERVTALILVVPAAGGVMPALAGGPRAWVMNVVLRFDLPMWLASHYMPKTMAKLMAVPYPLLDSLAPADRAAYDSTVAMLLPITARRKGLLMDAANQSGVLPGYPLEKISVPTLLVSTEDDLYGTMRVARAAAQRIPSAELRGFASGGHLLLGHARQMWPDVALFIRRAGVRWEDDVRPVHDAALMTVP